MRKRSVVLALAIALTLPACEDDLMIENFNAEDLDGLINNPTRPALTNATVGLLVGGRLEIDDGNGYVSLLGILGRESYNFDASDPRFITETLSGPLDPGSRAFGGNIWTNRYSNLRLGNIVLNGLEALGGPPGGFSAEEQEAIRGFVKTMQAHELLLVINTRDENGGVIAVDIDPRGQPGPIVGKTEVFAEIERLLDEGRDHLDNAGGSFPMPLTSGFDGFNTPSTFREFNRALAARVDVYTEDWMNAISNLNESFVDSLAPLDLGVYHVFSFISGDETSAGSEPGNDLNGDIALLNILAHPSVIADAETNGVGEPDLRMTSKTRMLESERVTAGLSSQHTFTLYPNPLSPIPIIRNEELMLLRAEANWNLGNVGDAEDEINFIRITQGGLEEVDLDGLSQAEFIDRIIYERRYSLLFEGGHRWIDARRLGRLQDLPVDLPTHVLNSAFPIPEEECLARGLEGTPGGGCS